MGKIRRCDRRCHNAKGVRCRCWCGGYYHGAKGTANRIALAEAEEVMERLNDHGFKQGETAYIDQRQLSPIGIAE